MKIVYVFLIAAVVLMLRHAYNNGMGISGFRRAPKLKMIVLTDAGIDDSDALILALSTESVKIVGISTIFGNVERDKVNINVNRVVKLFPEKNVPIYAGSTDPIIPLTPDKLLTRWKKDCGEDGLGDNHEVLPAFDESYKKAVVPGKNGSDAIFELVAKNPGCIIVCLAPLTDLALAMQNHKKLAKHKNLAHVYVLGGNVPPNPGETSPVYGTNIRRDVEATQYIFDNMERPITLIGKEAYGWGHDNSDTFEATYMNTDFEKGRFVKGTREFFQKKGVRTLYDELAVATAIAIHSTSAEAPATKSIIQHFQMIEHPITVQPKGDVRGQLLIDPASKKWTKHVKLVTAVDWDRVQQMLLDSLL